MCTHLQTAALASPPCHRIRALVSSLNEPPKRDRSRLGGGEGGRKVHIQLNICCSYLSSAPIFEACYVLALLQRAFLQGMWPRGPRVTPQDFIKSERRCSWAGLGNYKEGASSGQTYLWLGDLLSQLKEGDVAQSNPKSGL